MSKKKETMPSTNEGVMQNEDEGVMSTAAGREQLAEAGEAVTVEVEPAFTEAMVTNYEAADAMEGAEADAAPGPEFQLTPPPAELKTPDPDKPKKAKTAAIIGEIEEFDEVPEAGAEKKNPAYPWDKLDAGRMFKLRGVAKQGVSRSAKLWAAAHPGYQIELRDGSDGQGDYIGVYRTA